MILSWLKKKDIEFTGVVYFLAMACIFILISTILPMAISTSESEMTMGGAFLMGILIHLLFFLLIGGSRAGSDEDLAPYILIYFIIAFILSAIIGIFALNIEVPVLPWIAVGVIAFILMELLYWIDDEVPGKKKSKFWFSVYKKFDALADVLLIFLVAEAIALAWTYIKWEWVLWLLNTILGVLIQVAVAMIVTAAIIAALYGYIKLNQLKYGKDEKPKKKKKGRGKK